MTERRKSVINIRSSEINTNEQLNAVRIAPLRPEWVTYNPLTNTYDTKDGTIVAAELFENAQCFSDILHIARIRDEQRETKRSN
jgi:hypothetical protein